MSFDITKPSMTQANWAAALGSIRENFRAQVQSDSDIWSGQNLSAYGASTATTFTLYGSGGGTAYETFEIGSNRSDADALRAAAIVGFANANSSGRAIAAIDIYTDGATANNRGGQMRFLTRANAGSMTERGRITQGGLWLIGAGVTPVTLAHVYKGAASATLNSSLVQLTVENNADAGIEIACPNANIGRLLFTTPGTSGAGAVVRWDYTNTLMDIGTISSGSIRFMAGSFAETARVTTAAILPGSDNAFDFGSTTKRWRNVYAGRMVTGAATPTTSVQAGFGTGPSAAVDTGSSDLAGIITVTTGTTPGATGTIRVTFSTGNGALGTNTPCVTITPLDGAAAWDTGVTWKLTACSTTSFDVAWKNAATNFTASTTYKFAYCAIGK